MRIAFKQMLMRRFLASRCPRHHRDFIELAKQVHAFLSTAKLGSGQNFHLSPPPYSTTAKWANGWKFRNCKSILNKLSVKSIDFESHESPLVPPSNDICNTRYAFQSPFARREHTRTQQLKGGLNNSSRIHRGSFYSGRYIFNRGNGVDLGTGSKDGMFPNEMRTLNDFCRQLGVMRESNGDNVREVRPGMIKIGMVSMCGGLDLEVPTLSALGAPGICLVQKLNVAARKVCSQMMPGLLEEIQERAHIKVPKPLGGHNGLCSIMFQSKSLQNEAHFDPNDLSRCFANWASEDGKDHDGWYLLFPNIRYLEHGGATYDGLAIKLRDGIIVSWDGRELHHCSTRPFDDISTWGTWFGASKKALGHR
ncbi:unnamed protein product [Cylindrotheca closterium]|uniref:Uncharacterized protein n=1 Tax=Cylindrotheca closterium TaxID=2856 RepID=A0AAD2FRE3_9STRA|nr:unnamed protein product [Cylindrotheca closterium]